VKLVYLVFPLVVVSALLGSIAYYCYLAPEKTVDPAALERDKSIDASDRRYSAALKTIIASSTWFTNLDSSGLALDWSECAHAEGDGAGDIASSTILANKPAGDGDGNGSGDSSFSWAEYVPPTSMRQIWNAHLGLDS